MMGYGWGAGYLDSLGLSEDQQKKIASIQEDLWNKRFALMQSMHTLGWKSFGPGATSDVDASKAYEAMAALRKQMFDTSLEARKRIDEVLTKEQREELRSGPRGRW